MNGEEIIAFFQNLIDEDIDVDFAAELLNNAKDEIEGERDWEYLKTVDRSNLTSASSTYLTPYTLPTTFFTPRFIYVEGDYDPYTPVPFEHRERYRDASRRFYVDYAGGTFGLTGVQPAGKIINFFFTKTTTDWDSGNLDSVSPLFPARFHKILAFKMAELHQLGIDTDSVSQAQSPMQSARARVLMEGMTHWDARLKLHSMDYSATPRSRDISADPNVVTEI